MPSFVRPLIASCVTGLLVACGGGGEGGAGEPSSLRGRIVLDGEPITVLSASLTYLGSDAIHDFEVVDGVFELGSDLSFMTSGTHLRLLFEGGPTGTFSYTMVRVTLPSGHLDLGDIDLGRKGFGLTAPAGGATCNLPCAFSWSAFGGPAGFTTLSLYKDGTGGSFSAQATGRTIRTADLPDGPGTYGWRVSIEYEQGPALVDHGSAMREVTLRVP